MHLITSSWILRELFLSSLTGCNFKTSEMTGNEIQPFFQVARHITHKINALPICILARSLACSRHVIKLYRSESADKSHTNVLIQVEMRVLALLSFLSMHSLKMQITTRIVFWGNLKKRLLIICASYFRATSVK